MAGTEDDRNRARCAVAIEHKALGQAGLDASRQQRKDQYPLRPQCPALAQHRQHRRGGNMTAGLLPCDKGVTGLPRLSRAR